MGKTIAKVKLHRSWHFTSQVRLFVRHGAARERALFHIRVTRPRMFREGQVPTERGSTAVEGRITSFPMTPRRRFLSNCQAEPCQNQNLIKGGDMWRAQRLGTGSQWVLGALPEGQQVATEVQGVRPLRGNCLTRQSQTGKAWEHRAQHVCRYHLSLVSDRVWMGVGRFPWVRLPADYDEDDLFLCSTV